MMASTDISREIETDILNGIYKPGEKLNEYKLAERYGVSRTPIREALAKLVSEGIAEHHARRGTFVAKIMATTVFEQFELLALLESAAARLAARRISSDGIEKLSNIAKWTVDAAIQDAASYTAANTQFHEIIYAGSANAVLEEKIIQLRRKLTPYRNHIHRVAGHRLESANEHLRITDAIEKGQEDIAASLMFFHMDMHRPEFIHFVRQLFQALENK